MTSESTLSLQRWRATCAFAMITVACLAPGACGSSGGRSNPSNLGPTARFRLSGEALPNLLDVPFPSDAYLVKGKIVDPLPGAAAIFPDSSQYVTHELGRTNGFGRSSFALFYVDAAPSATDATGGPPFADVDPTSLPVDENHCVADASSVFLVDLEATDPSNARVRCRAAIHDDSATAGTQPVVAVGPGLGIVLPEGHRYAAVLTSRLRDKSGAHVSASADFLALLEGHRTGALGALYGSAIDKVLATLGDALSRDQSTLVGIAPFTTQSTSAEMFALRESLESMPVPTLAWDAQSVAPMGAVKFAAPVNGKVPSGFAASLDAWLGVAPKLSDGSDDPDYLTTGVIPHDHIAAIGTAVYQSPNFLVSKPGGYSTLDHATFARDATGAIVPNPAHPTVPIWVSLAIPATPMPPGGYPAVIVAHGLPSSRAELFMRVANFLAANGWIVVGIDLITNGARAPESQFQVDVLTDWQTAPGATYQGPDGLSDGLDASGKPAVGGLRNGNTDAVGQIINCGAYRDQMRQAEMDTSTLVRILASNPDLSPLATGAVAPRIDPTRIAYIGGSMGAVTGATTAAFEPGIRNWVLNVGAGHLASTFGSAPVNEAGTKEGFVAFGIKQQFLDETNPAIVIYQTILDAYDPLMYASFLVTSPGTIAGRKLAARNILAVEQLYDESAGNDGTEAWARAAGIGLAEPNVGTNAHVTTMAELRDPTKVPDRMQLPDVAPDGQGLVHDSPQTGITAVMIQVSPGTHYQNLTVSKGQRAYPAPFGATTKPLPVAKQYWVRNSYLELQATVTRFLADAFAGEVPNVTGFKPPVRDLDDDGNEDATDPDPNDPTVN